MGIIANPASGRDIRRLVAHGTVIDNLEKINILERVILGAMALGVDKIIIMPDTFGFGEKVIEKLAKRWGIREGIEILAMAIAGNQDDSTHAAQLMAEMGAKVIVTMGGDGTNRAVTKGALNIPLIPISTGTNNVFPTFLEGTVAGLAAAVVAGDQIVAGVYRHKKINVYKNEQLIDHALVDAVICKEIFIGSRAIWDLDSISQIALTRGQPTNIGLSSIGGYLFPVSPLEPHGVYLEIGGESSVLAPIAPGLVREVNISKINKLEPNNFIPIKKVPCIVALDGEREIEFSIKDQGYIVLDLEGPLVVDVVKTMEMAVKKQIFLEDKGLIKWL